ncbi:MAG5150 family histidine triad lipoprotein [Mycoplasmopsis adleri]|uniref:MAG5150 family histidine triad lipoprotein n=1 Tax=Mycoplasmopsis adleri TaxID=51362 RepID=UPI003872ACD0
MKKLSFFLPASTIMTATSSALVISCNNTGKNYSENNKLLKNKLFAYKTGLKNIFNDYFVKWVSDNQKFISTANKQGIANTFNNIIYDQMIKPFYDGETDEQSTSLKFACKRLNEQIKKFSEADQNLLKPFFKESIFLGEEKLWKDFIHHANFIAWDLLSMIIQNYSNVNDLIKDSKITNSYANKVKNGEVIKKENWQQALETEYKKVLNYVININPQSFQSYEKFVESLQKGHDEHSKHDHSHATYDLLYTLQLYFEYLDKQTNIKTFSFDKYDKVFEQVFAKNNVSLDNYNMLKNDIKLIQEFLKVNKDNKSNFEIISDLIKNVKEATDNLINTNLKDIAITLKFSQTEIDKIFTKVNFDNH